MHWADGMIATGMPMNITLYAIQEIIQSNIQLACHYHSDIIYVYKLFVKMLHEDDVHNQKKEVFLFEALYDS